MKYYIVGDAAYDESLSRIGVVKNCKVAEIHELEYKNIYSKLQSRRNISLVSDTRTQQEVTEQTICFFKSVIDSLEDGIVITDFSNAIIEVNHSFASILGKPVKDLLKTSFFGLMKKTDPAAAKPLVRVLRKIYYQKERITGFEYRLKERFFEINGTVVDYRGDAQAVLWVWRDVTDWKKMETALQKASDKRELQLQENSAELLNFNEELVQIFESAADGMCLINGDFRIHRVNETFSALFGLHKDEVVNKKCYEVLYGSLCHTSDCPMHRIHKSGERLTLEIEKKHTDGSKILCILTATPFRSSDGKLIGIVEDFKDITERKQAEEKIRGINESYKTLLRNIPDSIYSALPNKTGTRIFLSERWRDLTGYAPEDFYKDKTLWPKIIHSDDRIKAVQGYIEAFKGKKEYKVEYRVIHKESGETHYLIDHGRPIIDEKGNVVRIEGIVSDNTRYRLTEQRLQKQQKQLVQAGKMVSLGTLVSGVAHEINNPNNFITLNTPVLGEAWESIVPILDQYYIENGDFNMGGMPYSEMREEVTGLLSGILDGSQRIKNIVKRLKDFARPDSSDMEQLIDINDVVKSAFTLVSNLVKRSSKNVSVTYGKKMPLIKGNFQRLEQVVINLIQNACQALADSTKGLYILTSHDSKKVIVEIRDEGIGIPVDELEHIVDPFYTTKRDSGGTGLGLSISSGIVVEHGGKLDIQSKVGQGSCMTVFLPRPGEQESESIGD